MPLRAPVPVAWIILGFVLDDSLAQQLRSLTRAEVSLVHEEGGRWVSYGSTHGAPLRADLTARLTQAPWNYDETFDFDLVGDAYLTRVAGLGGQGAPTLRVAAAAARRGTRSLSGCNSCSRRWPGLLW